MSMRVYGWSGWWYTYFVGPISTTQPRYSITARSLM